MGDWEDTASSGAVRVAVAALSCWICLLLAGAAHANGQTAPVTSGLTLQKSAGRVEVLGSDRFRVPFVLTLVNSGTEVVKHIQVTDDLADELAPARIVAVDALRVTGGSQTANAGFDGRHDTALLSGSGWLAPGDGTRIEFRATFSTEGASGPFFNQAFATGKGDQSQTDVSVCSLSAEKPSAQVWSSQLADCQPTSIELPGEPARLGLAKAAEAPEWLGGGWYRTRFQFVAVNYSDFKAHNVQIYDDLGAAFGGIPVEVEGLTSPDWIINPTFDGLADARLLADGAYLSPGASALVLLTVRFRPGVDAQPIVNGACVQADGTACDRSTDGTDPDPDQDGSPDEAQDTLVFSPEPGIELTASAAPARYPGDGTVLADLTIVLRNAGNTPLEGLRVQNDLAATFAQAVDTFGVVPGSLVGDLLPINPGYDGVNDTDLLGGDAVLDPGETAAVKFSLVFEPSAGEGVVKNETVATTEQGVADRATARIEYALPVAPEPRIGLAKAAGNPVVVAPGVFETALSFHLLNSGAVPLTALKLTDDLRATFPAPATFEVVPGTLASERFLVNAGFDGSADTELLAAGNGLAAGESGSVAVRVRVATNGASGPFLNTAFVTTAEGAQDTSNAGTDPEAEGEAPTPIALPTKPAIGLVKSAGPVVRVDGESDTYEVSFHITVANLGDVTLHNVQVMDDLASTFPAPATFALAVPPSVTGALEEPGPGYGAGSFALLSGAESLAVGEQAVIEFAVRFSTGDDTELFFNQAFASAVDPRGKAVFDSSGAELGLDDTPTPVLLPGALRGTVYLDLDHDRQFNDAVDETLAGWTIELLGAERTSLRSATTGTAGTYDVRDIPPAGYAVQFRHPETGVVWGRVDIQIVARGIVVVDHPIDPQGVVYDAETRAPLPGAVLSLLDGDGQPLPDACLLPDQQSQPVGSRGRYRFTILHGRDPRCPSERAEYRLAVSGVPDGYRQGLSTLIPPEPGPLDADTCEDPCLVQAQNLPPTGDDATTYHAAFLASGGGVTVVNNHVPVDPLLLPPPPPPPEETPRPELSLEMSASRRSVTAGGIVGYTLTLENRSDLPINGAVVSDLPPPAFQIDTDAVLLVRAGPDGLIGSPDDVREELGGRGSSPVVFDPLEIGPRERVEIRYASRVSTGVRAGLQISRASAYHLYEGISYAVSDSAAVEVRADPLFDRATVIGKVFHDRDSNGIQDDGEPGMYKVRLITPEGLIVETDAQGRYHIADIDVTRDYGINYALKLDPSTLPDGWESRSDPRQVVHLAPGGIGRVNFAVSTPFDIQGGDDCCGHYTDFRYVDPYRIERRLDVRPSALSHDGATWEIEFGVSSNYNVQAPFYRLELFDPEDLARTAPLGSACGVLENPHQFVRMADLRLPNRRRMLYRMTVYEQYPEDEADGIGRRLQAKSRYPVLKCGLGAFADRRAHDVTHTLELYLPIPSEAEAWRDNRSYSPGSALAERGIRLDHVVMTQSVRRYEKKTPPRAVTYQERERLVNRNEVLLKDFRGDPIFDVQPKRNPDPEPPPGELPSTTSLHNVPGVAVEPLIPGTDLEVKFDRQPTQMGRAWLQRDSLFQPHNVVYGAEGTLTSMLCCDLETSVETVMDQNNRVYAIRLKNGSPVPITPEFSGLEACDQIPDSVIREMNEPVDGLATREYYVGGFHREGPEAEACRSTIEVKLTSAALPGHPNMKYEIERGRFEENGQWRPPRTTAYCLEVEGQPQIAEGRGVAAIRVSDEKLEREIPSVEPILIEDVDASFGIAVLDLTVGSWSASGGLEDYAAGLGLDDSHADGRIAAYWRGVDSLGSRDVRWVVQVDSTKDDLDNLFHNLKRRDPDRLFRQLDPDRYYPTYGDDSTTTLDTNSQGAFYARITSNLSQAQWGNYNTGLTGTEFAQYNRSLYGLIGDYRSDATTTYGDSRLELKAFGSEAETASGHASFLATGGSLYYLPHTDIVMGSEKVWVEVRRRDTEQVEERQILLPGRDYEVDPLQGRILLQSPLSQVMRERLRNVVRTRPLEGDDVFLLVDYEYLTGDFNADDYVYGLRGRGWIGNSLAVGATHVTDEQGQEDYALNGLDLLWRHGRNSYLSAEFARTSAERSGSGALSVDGGLTFENAPSLPASDRGDQDAWGVEAQLDLSDHGNRPGLMRAWWKHRDEGFSSPRFSPGAETVDLGIDFEVEADEHWTLSGGATDLDRQGERELVTARVQSAGRWRCPRADPEQGCVELDVEGRFEDLELETNSQPLLPFEERDGSATLLGARAGYWVSDATTLYTSAQKTLSTQRDYEANDLLALGANTQFSDAVALSLEASDGDRGSALMAGADYRLNHRTSFNLAGGVGSGALSRFAGRYQLREGQELFGTYTMDPDRTDGARNLLSVGQRSDAGSHVRIYTESQFGRGNGEQRNGHVGGIELERSQWVFSTNLQKSSVRRGDESFDRVAAGFGATYGGETTRLSSRFEVRDDDGPSTDVRQYVTSNGLMHQLSEDARLIGKLNLAWTDDRLSAVDTGRFAEFSVGYAYRPVAHDGFNGMMRYDFLYDVGTPGQSDAPGDEKAHVLSTEGFIDVTPRLGVGGKLAYRGGKTRIEKGAGDWYDLSLGMAIARVSFRVNVPGSSGSGRLLPDQVELLGEYRWLEDFEGGSTQRGALLGIYRQFDPRHRADDGKPRGGQQGTGRPRLVPPTLRVGVGYNFSGFDDDMRMDNYKSHGWFVDLMAVF